MRGKREKAIMNFLHNNKDFEMGAEFIKKPIRVTWHRVIFKGLL